MSTTDKIAPKDSLNDAIQRLTPLQSSFSSDRWSKELSNLKKEIGEVEFRTIAPDLYIWGIKSMDSRSSRFFFEALGKVQSGLGLEIDYGNNETLDPKMALFAYDQMQSDLDELEQIASDAEEVIEEISDIGDSGGFERFGHDAGEDRHKDESLEEAKKEKEEAEAKIKPLKEKMEALYKQLSSLGLDPHTERKTWINTLSKLEASNPTELAVASRNQIKDKLE